MHSVQNWIASRNATDYWLGFWSSMPSAGSNTTQNSSLFEWSDESLRASRASERTHYSQLLEYYPILCLLTKSLANLWRERDLRGPYTPQNMTQHADTHVAMTHGAQRDGAQRDGAHRDGAQRDGTYNMNALGGTHAFEVTLPTSDDVAFYFAIYAALCAINSLFTILRAFTFAYGGLRSARVLHHRLLHCVLKVFTHFVRYLSAYVSFSHERELFPLGSPCSLCKQVLRL